MRLQREFIKDKYASGSVRTQDSFDFGNVIMRKNAYGHRH